MSAAMAGPGSSPAEELQARRSRALAMGSPKRLAERAAAGRLNARERIAAFCDDDSEFLESGQLAVSFRDEDRERTPADGKITGIGRVDGRQVGIVANDFTVLGASSSVTNGSKIRRLRHLAERVGAPVVFLAESAGARMPDRMGAEGRAILGQDAEEYLRVRSTPWVSALLGPCYGSSAWYTAMSDYVVMRRDAVLAVAGARVIGQALGGSLDDEELGGWQVHTRHSGLVDVVVDSDEEALEVTRRFLSYLPSSARCAPPRVAPAPAGGGDVAGLVPEQSTKVYDVRAVVRAIVDKGSVLDVKKDFGRSLSTCLARLDGRTVGILANNPMFKGGAIDIDACAKAASFLTLCDSFNIPLVMLCDTPGFLIGPEGEKRAAAGRIMTWMNALTQFSMPKVTVILRKSYGQAYLNMGGGRNSDEVAAWPSADLGFMDPRTGAAILAKRGAGGETNADMLAVQLRRDSAPEGLARRYGVQTLLAPADTRTFLIEALDQLRLRATGEVGRHALANWPTTI